MSAYPRWLPWGLILLGAVLVLTAVAIPVMRNNGADSAAAPVPEQIDRLSLVSRETGSAALSDITRLHGKSFPVRMGTKAVYGTADQITLWVAGTDSEIATHQLLDAMRRKIAEGNSPFQTAGTQQDGARNVYALDGLGQKHFYFQSGVYLVWLAVDAEMSNVALEQTLNFYR